MNAPLDYDAKKYLCLGIVLVVPLKLHKYKYFAAYSLWMIGTFLEGLAELKGCLRLPVWNPRFWLYSLIEPHLSNGLHGRVKGFSKWS